MKIKIIEKILIKRRENWDQERERNAQTLDGAKEELNLTQKLVEQLEKL